jgi:hypothetical protein
MNLRWLTKPDRAAMIAQDHCHPLHEVVQAHAPSFTSTLLAIRVWPETHERDDA